MEYHDSIIYEEEAIKILKDAKYSDLLNNAKYSPIFIALRKGPLTIKELEKEYNSIVKKDIKKMDLEDSEKKKLGKKMFRKDKTLYKYISKLRKSGLIVEAGKRFKVGQTAAETLFGRAAKLYLMDDKSERTFSMGEDKKYLSCFAKIISLINDSSKVSVDCLAEVMTDFLTQISEETEKIFKTYSKEITKIASDMSFSDIHKTLKGLNMFLLIRNASNFEEMLEKCSKK